MPGAEFALHRPQSLREKRVVGGIACGGCRKVRSLTQSTEILKYFQRALVLLILLFFTLLQPSEGKWDRDFNFHFSEEATEAKKLKACSKCHSKPVLFYTPVGS